MRTYLSHSVGCLIVPQLLKAGFIVGASGGDGVLVGRNPGDGSWSAPAFYTLAAGSLGPQVGAQMSEVVLIVNSPRGLDAIFEDRMKLGADASVAAGPVGKGVATATMTSLAADITSYARSKGLFAGVTVEGAGLSPSAAQNAAYYGRSVSPRNICVDRLVDNPAAAQLKQALARVAAV